MLTTEASRALEARRIFVRFGHSLQIRQRQEIDWTVKASFSNNNLNSSLSLLLAGWSKTVCGLPLLSTASFWVGSSSTQRCRLALFESNLTWERYFYYLSN